MNEPTVYTEAPGAPAAIGPYSPAVKAGGLVFLSGQIGLDPATGNLVPGGFAAETHRTFNNLAAVCTAAGGQLKDIVKLNVFLLDINNFALFNDIAAEYLASPYPARAAIAVAALPKGAVVEIEGIMLARHG